MTVEATILFVLVSGTIICAFFCIKNRIEYHEKKKRELEPYI